MAYVKVGPWVNAGIPPISAANLDTVETQYDEAKTDLDAHKIANIYHRWAAGKVLVGAGAGADPTEVDKGSTLTIAETEVFSGNTPAAAAWTDLDLSGTVGANVALVILKWFIGVASQQIAFRKNGDADEHYGGATSSSGLSLGAPAANIWTIYLVLTDATGKIEWICQDLNEAVTIDVIAYIK